jgi:hypothetical protein
MSNYRTMVETNGRLNLSRRKIKSDRDYLQAILNATTPCETAIAVAQHGMAILEVMDRHTCEAYVSTGCQYDDDRMAYLNAHDLLWDCEKEIEGTSVQEEIEKEIAYEVAIRIAENRFVAVMDFFNNRSNLRGMVLPEEFMNVDGPMTLSDHQFYVWESMQEFYDGSDYD